MIEELIRRLSEIERRLDNWVKPERGLQFTRADKDGDGDYDPLTSASWDGDSFSTGTGTIDWEADFGVPANAEAVLLLVEIADSDSANNNASIKLQAKSTTTNYSLHSGSIRGTTNDQRVRNQGVVPIASDGTSYYSITATGASTLDAWIFVVGWYI